MSCDPEKDLSLENRRGWPPELCVLLERHPREEWHRHGSAEAEFWLAIHAGFRQRSTALAALGNDYRQRRIPAAHLAARVVPELRAMVAHLEGHHRIEDHQYFPAFRAADTRLARGFDALGADHERLHGDIGAALRSLDTLWAAAQPGTAAAVQDAAAERHIMAADSLYRRLAQHLSDEEDLIVPLLLERDL